MGDVSELVWELAAVLSFAVSVGSKAADESAWPVTVDEPYTESVELVALSLMTELGLDMAEPEVIGRDAESVAADELELRIATEALLADTDDSEGEAETTLSLLEAT